MDGPAAFANPAPWPKPRISRANCEPAVGIPWTHKVNRASHLRWRIAVLVSAAIAISYLDRLTLPVAVSAIGKDIPLSNQQFSALQSIFLFAYAFMYAGGGKLTDALGTRLRPRWASSMRELRLGLPSRRR